MITANTYDLPPWTKHGGNLLAEEGFLRGFMNPLEENHLAMGMNMSKTVGDLQVKAGHLQKEELEDHLTMVGILHMQNGLTLQRGTDTLGDILLRGMGDILHKETRGMGIHKGTRETGDILHKETRETGDILHKETSREDNLLLGPVLEVEESLQ
jgi:hypothetical protein